MVGRQDDKDSVVETFQSQVPSKGECWCSISAFGFEQNIRVLDIHFTKLLGHEKSMFFIADEDGVGGIGMFLTARYGIL